LDCIRRGDGSQLAALKEETGWLTRGDKWIKRGDLAELLEETRVDYLRRQGGLLEETRIT
jgi:hypothetical protein